MKIFIVQSHLGGGGAERVGVLLANGFAQRNHEVYMVTNLFEDAQYAVDNKVTLLNLMSTNHGKIRKWCSAVHNLRKFVKRYKPDVIIGIMQLCSFVSKFACLGTKTNVIMTEHGTFEHPLSAPMSMKNHFCKFHLNKIYSNITVITQADKDYIGDKLKNVTVMPNPLLLSPLKEIPRKRNVILAVGRLDDWHYKGFDVLINAWGKVITSSKFQVSSDGWKLQIAGAGNEKSLKYLKQLCKENKVESSVEFLGFRKDVEKLYQDASIFVLSSRYEGFGLVLIEAMSQGCACIACDYKGRQREILNPDRQVSSPEFQVSGVESSANGICCKPDDVEVLVSAIQYMLINNEYRESVRVNAISRSEYYSLNNTIDRWEQFLFQLNNSKTIC